MDSKYFLYEKKEWLKSIYSDIYIFLVEILYFLICQKKFVPCHIRPCTIHDWKFNELKKKLFLHRSRLLFTFYKIFIIWKGKRKKNFCIINYFIYSTYKHVLVMVRSTEIYIFNLLRHLFFFAFLFKSNKTNQSKIILILWS